MTSLRPRVAALLATIRRERGEWTTELVRKAHRANGFRATQRSTARRDLELLERAQYLVRHDRGGTNRYYTLNSKRGDA